MNLGDWAKNEIDIACKNERGDKDLNEWDYGVACYESAHKAFQSLLEDEHSGMSIGFTKAILNRLIDTKPLTPIEDTPDIWSDVVDKQDDYTSYQCKRMSSFFKHVYKDGTITYTDTDRAYCLNKDDLDAPCWTNGFVNRLINKLFPITMPYYPPSKPYYVYCTEGLSNPENGDFDTLGIWYVLTPYGEHVDINRFFKESLTGFTEISQEEYNNRINSSYNDDKNERNLVAVSIKHTIHGWKFGMPCWLWGSRTKDEEKRSFAGYTQYPNNAEVYSLEEWQESSYGAGDVCKVDEPVQMCVDFCKKYKKYDTVLVPLDQYVKYCECICLPLNKPKGG